MKLHHFKKVLGGGGMPPNPLTKRITPNLKTIRAPPPATCWLPWLVVVGYAPAYTKRLPII